MQKDMGSHLVEVRCHNPPCVWEGCHPTHEENVQGVGMEPEHSV